MKTILDHLDNVVRPALRNYADAEKALTASALSGDTDALEKARLSTALAARQAAYELHHLTDFVFKEKTRPFVFATLNDVRSAVEAKCVFLRAGNPVTDVSLLRDVADAFKHHELDRPSASIARSSDIAPQSTGFGEARFGEGKFGGVEQFMITAKNGDKRALSSVLQDVFDAWMTLLGQPLPSINTF